MNHLKENRINENHTKENQLTENNPIKYADVTGANPAEISSRDMVIIPAYCPTAAILSLVDKIDQERYEVIVVDDGSGAAYSSIFEKLPFVLTHEVNMGKGCAIKTALQYIHNNQNMREKDVAESGDNNSDPISIVTMDCDGQHTVEDAERLLQVARQNPGKLILGARDFSGKIPWKSKVGNLLTKGIFRLSQKVALQDTQTGLRAFSAELIPTFLEVSGKRYEYEMNVLSYCAKNGIEMIEVPIATIYHDQDNSGTHFRAVKDSLLVYHDVIKFTLSSLSSFAVDYILFGIFTMVLKGMPEYILISNVLARLISAVYNYLVNVKLVFRMKKVTIRSALQYFLLAIFILCMNNIILSTVLYVTGMPAMVAKVITELILFSLSFLVQHLFIFKKKENRR